VSLVDDRLRQPNGIALSPDGTTLYVGAYSENKIYKYAVRPDGSTGARSVFVPYVGGPDGVTVDCAGNVYWASGFDALVHVYSPAGVQLGTIRAGSSGTTNVAFGGPDEDGRRRRGAPPQSPDDGRGQLDVAGGDVRRLAPVHPGQVQQPVGAVHRPGEPVRVGEVGPRDDDRRRPAERPREDPHVPAEEPVRAGDGQPGHAGTGSRRASSARISGSVRSISTISGTVSRRALAEVKSYWAATSRSPSAAYTP
jgi:hypothetical protein